MMRIIAANLAVTALNLLSTIGITICRIMQIPPPSIPLAAFITGDLLLSAIVWVVVFRLCRDPVGDAR